MRTIQQKQTFKHFSKDAKRWAGAAKGKYFVNTIKQRNDYVLSVLKEQKLSSLLDVGCGSGDLVYEAAKKGIKAEGIDFSAEMIAMATSLIKKNSIAGVRVFTGDVFNHEFSNKTYSCISANGFIEYISLAQLDVFLSKVHSLLNKKGSFVFGSRNRLFNIASFNDYTREEIKNQEIIALIEEAVHLSSKGLKGWEKVRAVDLPKDHKKYAKTSNIQVTTRHQFTPIQLMRLLSEKGFKVKDISPIHIHPAGLFLKSSNPEEHVALSDILQLFSRSQESLLPFASSFMIHAVKK